MTTSSQHTPGPWETRGDKVCEATSGDVIAATSEAGAFAAKGQWYAQPATFVTDGNARLIAAAPELLQACEKLAAWDASDDDSRLISEACSFARAAVAKARGGAQ